MYTQWINLRKEFIFDTHPKRFVQHCMGEMNRWAYEYEIGDMEKRKELAGLIANIAIDLQSYLPEWHLLKPADGVQLTKKEIAVQSEKMLAMLKNWGCKEKAEAAENEISSFENSNLIKLSKMADAGKINNRWGNDNGLGIMEAMRRGAALVTTNPPIVNMAREARPDVFDTVRDEINRQYPDESVERRVSRLTMNVVLNNCRALRRIYEITKGELGYVNFQVNPKNYKDSAKMTEEILFAYGEMAKALSGKPNVVFKVPGTAASLQTVRSVTAMGIGVNITVNFAVSQCAAFAETIEAGCADKSYITIMAGRLDDPVANELEMVGTKNAKELSRMTSRMVTRRVYNELLLKKEYKQCEILVASLRGSWNIDAAITDLPGSRIVISTFPDKAQDFDISGMEIRSSIRDMAQKEILDSLGKSRIFRQAYDLNGIAPQDFEKYIPVVQTLTSFIEVYEKLENYMGQV